MALINATGEALSRLVRNESVRLRLSYHVAGRMVGSPLSHSGSFAVNSDSLSDSNDGGDEEVRRAKFQPCNRCWRRHCPAAAGDGDV